MNTTKLVRQIRARLRNMDSERKGVERLLKELEKEVAPGSQQKTTRRGPTKPPARRAPAGSGTGSRSRTEGQVSRKELVRQAKGLGIKGSDRMSREDLEANINAQSTQQREAGRIVARPRINKISSRGASTRIV